MNEFFNFLGFILFIIILSFTLAYIAGDIDITTSFDGYDMNISIQGRM